MKICASTAQKTFRQKTSRQSASTHTSSAAKRRRRPRTFAEGMIAHSESRYIIWLCCNIEKLGHANLEERHRSFLCDGLEVRVARQPPYLCNRFCEILLSALPERCQQGQRARPTNIQTHEAVCEAPQVCNNLNLPRMCDMHPT
jgi:hypothetical protein